MDGSGTARLVGAYGFQLDAAEFDQRYLHDAAPDWPRLAVEFGGPPPAGTGPDCGWRAALSGAGWEVHVRRGGDAVRWYGAQAPCRDERVHPLLSLAACAATLERGGDCLHAGAVLTPDGVVAILGSSSGGKTSTMAWLAQNAGLDVFTDDHLNLRDGLAHAGPTCLDLRPDAAVRLGLRRLGRPVRGAERVRLEVKPPALVRAPVVRTAVLEWGSSLQISTVPPRDRLGILCTHRTAQPVAGDPRVPLDLAALPMLRLRRPRTFDNLPEITRALIGS